jgi:hypothetical protein
MPEMAEMAIYRQNDNARHNTLAKYRTCPVVVDILKDIEIFRNGEFDGTKRPSRMDAPQD